MLDRLQEMLDRLQEMLDHLREMLDHLREMLDRRRESAATKSLHLGVPLLQWWMRKTKNSRLGVPE